MNTLPSIENFGAYVLNLSKTISTERQNTTAKMDLDSFHANLEKAKNKQQDLAMTSDCVINPTRELYKLFRKEFFFSFSYMISPILAKYIGYSNKHHSLTISLIDTDDNVKAIAIRKSKDKDGNLIKWKTYGSKTFIPYKINDEFIFLAVGMAEFLLLEMMKVSYILLQSDSVYRHISQEIISKTNDKYLVILKENDESFSKLITELQSIFISSNIIVVDFEKLLNRQLPHGFDYRDYCNEIGDISIVEQRLEQEIIKQLKDKQ